MTHSKAMADIDLFPLGFKKVKKQSPLKRRNMTPKRAGYRFLVD